MELYYRRVESVRKGRTVPARTQTVVIYLPDVRSCMPTRIEWDDLNAKYKRHLDTLLKPDAEGGVPANNDVVKASQIDADSGANKCSSDTGNETLTTDVDQAVPAEAEVATVEAAANVADEKLGTDSDVTANEKALHKSLLALLLFVKKIDFSVSSSVELVQYE